MFRRKTIYSIIKSHANQFPKSNAILGLDKNALTYSQLLDQLNSVAGILNGIGIKKNDRVAIVLENGPDMAVCFLAVAAYAASAPLNPAYGFEDYDFYFSDLNAKAVILRLGKDSPARRVAQMLEMPIIELENKQGSNAGAFDLRTDKQGSGKKVEFSGGDDNALILHTSGTTSRPKIVPLTNGNLTASAGHISETLKLSRDDCCLNVMPLFHIHGLMGALLSTINAGGSIVCCPGFDSTQFYNWLQVFHPTWYSAVPTMHQAVLSGADDHLEIISNSDLRFIRSSSASLPPSVMQSLEELFNCPVIESYGMTEASHQMTSNPLPPGKRKPGSVGIPAGPEVGILDNKSNLLGPNEEGEIVIRGPNVTLGYENNPDANRSAFTKNWFRTGDLGKIDEDGYLYISGRIKEIINRGGEKIAPREIDEVFLSHPDVVQAVSFAVPHPTLGEDLATAVILAPIANITDLDLRSYAFDRLPDFKVPSRVIILDQIPKGPTGKLQRIGLAEKLASQMTVDYTAARNNTEAKLTRVWEKVLGIEKVGVFDNFFFIGGDSLSAIQVVVEIKDIFSLELSTNFIFKYPTIAQLAKYIDELDR